MKETHFKELDLVVNWLTGVGMPGAVLEAQGETLIVKLPPECRNQLLADIQLRKSLVQKIRNLGFAHVALEL